MRSDAAPVPETSAACSALWSDRKQNYATVQSDDLRKARKAYAHVVEGRTICPTSPLAALGTALRNDTIEAVKQAARNLHQMRTGQSYRYQSCPDAPNRLTTRMARLRQSRRSPVSHAPEHVAFGRVETDHRALDRL